MAKVGWDKRPKYGEKQEKQPQSNNWWHEERPKQQAQVLPTVENPVGEYRVNPRNMPDALLVKVEACEGEADRFWVKVMIDDPNPLLGGMQFEVWRDEIQYLRQDLDSGNFSRVTPLPLKREDF